MGGRNVVAGDAVMDSEVLVGQPENEVQMQ
jgi:hypothetical protein